MSLLEFEKVSKRFRHGSHQLDVLREVSLQLHPGELVAVWGLRRSGRSTLLRLAAGVEAPDHGVVRFAGEELLAHNANALANGIAFCHPHLHRPPRQRVLDAVIMASLARGETPAAAKARAHAALERTGVQRCAHLRPHELDSAELKRVAIAGALTTEPSLLLIDEPTKGVDLLDRDGILKLLRSLAKEGITVLTTVGESTGLFGADRALSLSNGQIHGSVTPQLAPVLRLPRRATA